MPNLRQILDRKTVIDLQAYGTPEGVEKSWDTRGRGRKAEEKKANSWEPGYDSKGNKRDEWTGETNSQIAKRLSEQAKPGSPGSALPGMTVGDVLRDKGGQAPPSGPRDLGTIAREISKDWGGKVNYAAKPYLDAMRSLGSMKDNYGQDSAHSVVAYFLSNASSWRGPVAQRVKTELKGMLKGR